MDYAICIMYCTKSTPKYTAYIKLSKVYFAILLTKIT